eukprot:TRINITY_DN791_c0_g1_i3.p1 TRINITY_DN791_c0_g1~~TRINITY_DN791_c0_g1_i3.p1  ORF type:complete len:525 (+),score=132.21 TRINITY_DN791_c0_g1_i3:996-2570(+)
MFAYTLAMVISESGIILQLGSSDEILEQYHNIVSHNLEQKYVYPGFIDAHTHLASLGSSLVQADLRYSKSIEEVQNRIQEYMDNHDKIDGWLYGRGWDQTLFPTKEFPTRFDLDEQFPDVPIYLSRIDGHAAWVNTVLLDTLEIPDYDPEGGEIVRDNDGIPTGIFIDSATNIILENQPPTDEDTVKQELLSAIEETKKYGITSVHDAGIDETTFNAMRHLISVENFDIRVYAMVAGGALDVEGVNGTKSVDRWCKRGQVINFEKKLTVKSAKMLIDGALGSRGAALMKDYSDDPGNRGLILQDPESYLKEVQKWIKCRFQVNTHAIGDLGNRIVLDTYINATQNLKKNIHNLRLRVEHAQIVTPEDVEKFVDNEIIASMQPTHATSDMNYAEDRLGPERIKNAYLWNTFLQKGVKLALGSDFPVEEVNPLLGFYAAVTRQDLHGQPLEGWYPEERISRYDALQGFTLNAAYAAFQEGYLGSLRKDKYADFIVLSDDIMEIEPLLIPDVKVLKTFLGGKVVYEA